MGKPKKPEPKPAPKITSIGWDFKSFPDFDEMQKALSPFGIYVYPDPMWEGQDGAGFILSDKPLTRKQIRAFNGD
jgi:hypothetical protein